MKILEINPWNIHERTSENTLHGNKTRVRQKFILRKQPSWMKNVHTYITVRMESTEISYMQVMHYYLENICRLTFMDNVVSTYLFQSFFSPTEQIHVMGRKLHKFSKLNSAWKKVFFPPSCSVSYQTNTIKITMKNWLWINRFWLCGHLPWVYFS